MPPEKNWERHEREVQELLGLSATPGSGNQWHSPSDGVDNTHYSSATFPLMVDCKCTVNKSYSVTREFMAKWREKAEMAGKRFALPIRFAEKDPRSHRHEDYIVLTLDDFAELLELAKGR